MTREQFIEKWRHEFGGMILDAATAQRTGADLSVALRQVMRKIDSILGIQWDALQPKPPALNGTAAKPAEVKK